MQVRYIVQDLDTFEFLCSENGDIGQTPYIAKAGQFDSFDDAVIAAIDEIGEAFTIFTFMSPEAQTDDEPQS
ncbi:hypothetical protein QG071_08810 [Kingella kingae]|uniref:hypothetical protein n=1 Tax=Kingella kingae TaxID=504 RepID=UPI00031DC7DC|nr:hypothetical protein [Kingella kingae]MDK4556132.1 hypothetical protein [Kingella kingae]MDK4577333.1 hypothetical protein [Kingella kingae]MDK4583344.1 hypothetical protein [Kingella kingae]MDK4585304.1 hypothetical protein [Kingella kingae]MDK4589271.1 hypothetical protein [Kingella kingae]